jgi:hypothetical protein
MGYTTDFDPPLNDDEIAYLIAFSRSRRCRRPSGVHVVHRNPTAETSEGLDRDSYNSCAEEQAGLWCDWVPCWDGCCLVQNGKEMFCDPGRDPLLRSVMTRT